MFIDPSFLSEGLLALVCILGAYGISELVMWFARHPLLVGKAIGLLMVVLFLAGFYWIARATEAASLKEAVWCAFLASGTWGAAASFGRLAGLNPRP